MTLQNAYTYFITSITCLLIAFVIYRQIKDDMGNKAEILYLRLFHLGYISFVLTNIVCLWSNYYKTTNIGYIFSALNLISLFVTAYFWFSFIETKINAEYLKSKFQRVISLLPLLMTIVLSLTTYYTHLIFYYDLEQTYQKGNLYIIMVIISMFYIVLASAHIITKINSTKTKVQKSQYYYLAAFLLFPFIAGVLDFFLPHQPLMELSVLFGIVIVYVSLKETQMNSDTLTDLNNRRYIENYIESVKINASEENPVYLFICDIDNFKNINDEYGHLEGDYALKVFSQVLYDFSQENECEVCRWGGDEFIIVCKKRIPNRREFVKSLKDLLQKRVDDMNLPYELKMSVGYSKFLSPDDYTQDIINKADTWLYRLKHRIFNDEEINEQIKLFREEMENEDY